MTTFRTLPQSFPAPVNGPDTGPVTRSINGTNPELAVISLLALGATALGAFTISTLRAGALRIRMHRLIEARLEGISAHCLTPGDLELLTASGVQRNWAPPELHA